MPDNPETTRYFVDTNIWLYAFIKVQDGVKSDAARVFILSSEPILSTQVVNEVCINLLRRANFTEEQIGRLIESFYTKYTVMELKSSSLMAASRLRQQYAFSFWDSLIVASALEAGVSRLYSEDMQSGLIIDNQLEIVNPFVVQ